MSASCHRQAGRIANFVLRCHEAKIALYTRRWEGTKPVARSQAVKPTPLNGVLDSVLSRPRTALITCLLFLAGLFIADLATPKSVLLDALYVIPAAAAVVALRSAWATGVWLVALSLQVISEAKESADLPTMAVEACGLTAVCLVVLFVRRASGDWGRVGVQEDRSRVARELHDGVIQSLAAAQMLLELDADSIPEPARRSVSRAAESIREAIQDMYSYIFELEPNGLLHGGLERSLSRLVDEYSQDSRLRLTLNIDHEPLGGLDSHGVDVLQIAREALANVTRHAQARHACFDLGLRDGNISLDIRDDGIGFDPETAQGLGIRNLKIRAGRLGGKLDVKSRPGEGSLIHVSVPRAS